jgi:hypothetical protein
MNLLILAQAGAEGESPAVALRTDYSILSLLVVGLVALAVLIGFGVAIANGSRPLSMAKRLGGLAGTIWVVPMLAAIGWFAYAHRGAFESAQLERSAGYRPGDVTFDSSPGHHRIRSSDGGNFVTPEGEPLPPWVFAEQHRQGDTLLVPIHSALWATEGEAKLDARQHALQVVKQDLQLAYPAPRRLPLGSDVQVSVQDSAIGVEERNLGAASTKMYRAHLLVEISESTHRQFARMWRRQVGDMRLAVLCAGGLLLTLLWVASAAYLRFDLQTESRYRGWLKIATTAGVLAGVVIAHGKLANYSPPGYGWTSEAPSADADPAN